MEKERLTLTRKRGKERERVRRNGKHEERDRDRERWWRKREDVNEKQSILLTLYIDIVHTIYLMCIRRQDLNYCHRCNVRAALCNFIPVSAISFEMLLFFAFFVVVAISVNFFLSLYISLSFESDSIRFDFTFVLA